MRLILKNISIVLSALILLHLAGCEKEIIKVKEDITPPVILTAPYSATSTGTATIFWTTDEPCSVAVKYVVVDQSDTASISGVEYRQNHQVTLVDLLANTTYRYYTLSYDIAGNYTRTTPASFTTSIDTAYYLTHGWDLYAAGDYTGARESFRQYVAYFPDNLAGLTALGWSQLQDSLVDSSIITYNTVLGMNDEYADALAGLVVALYRDYHLNALQISVEKLLGLDSLYIFSNDERYTHRMFRLMLAESYNVAGRLEDAQEIVDLLHPENGLDPADSTTWKIVDGEDTYIYDSYQSALTNLIEYLKYNWWEAVGLPKPRFYYPG